MRRVEITAEMFWLHTECSVKGKSCVAVAANKAVCASFGQEVKEPVIVKDKKAVLQEGVCCKR